ncbi:MAG: hypothetical protein DRO67_00790 [Candidatus Asgardarchaeum californiense]|nr:MAG: hypothetical protein DRO67_00790 [Candidatus Asgardarchaeum californiense]
MENIKNTELDLLREKIFRILKSHLAEDYALKIKCAYLYGSILKDKAFIDKFSDIDVLVISDDETYSLRNIGGVYDVFERLSHKHGVNFDVTIYSSSYVLNGLKDGDPFLNVVVRDGILVIDNDCDDKIKQHKFTITGKTLKYELNYCMVVLGRLFTDIIEHKLVSAVNRAIHLAKYSTVMLILSQTGELVIDDELIKQHLEDLGLSALYYGLSNLYNTRRKLAENNKIKDIKLHLSDLLYREKDPLKILIIQSYNIFSRAVAMCFPYNFPPFESFVKFLVIQNATYIKGAYFETEEVPTIMLGLSNGNIKIIKLKQAL